MMTRVFCVLRSGGDLYAGDVARLATCLRKNSGHELYCLSDVDVPCSMIPLAFDWSGWWAKMELFRPDIEGDVLYFDLDTVIVGNVEHFVNMSADTLLSDFYYPWRPNSGIMYLTEATRVAVWKRWFADVDHNMNRYAKGDGAFLASLPIGKEAHRWQKIFPGQVISFKMNMRPSEPFAGPQLIRPPPEARVVCFHGIPRPMQVNEPWIKEAWEY